MQKQVLDTSFLKELDQFEGKDGKSYVEILANSFSKIATQQISEINLCLKANDLKKIERLANSLHQNAGGLGLSNVEEICTKLEEAAKANNANAIPTLITELKDHFQQGLAALKKYNDSKNPETLKKAA